MSQKRAQMVRKASGLGHQKEFLHGKSSQAQEQAAQGSGEVPIPGGTEAMWGRGIEMRGQGLVTGLGWSGRLLDLMILKVFASLNDSRILYFGKCYITMVPCD